MIWRGLLVSVRNAAEAAEALAGGAAIIDVKEPRSGALGPAAPEAIAAVAGVVGRRSPWTMACGELGSDSAAAVILDLVSRVWPLLPPAAVPPAALKIGLAGAVHIPWQQRLQDLFQQLPAGTERVAVAYADWQRARAPSPEQVIAAAPTLGCRTLLIDTFDKAAGGLFDCCPPDRPAAWVAAARAAGLQVAVAGRITVAEIPAAWALRPDVVALRSAVCFNGRDGAVQAALVRRAVWLRVAGPEGSSPASTHTFFTP